MPGVKSPDDASAWLVLADRYVDQSQAERNAASAAAKPSRTRKPRRRKSVAETKRLKDRLALADRHIAGTEENITHQAALIRRLATEGRDTNQASDLLRLMGRTLDALHEHRRSIVGEIPKAARPRRHPAAPLISRLR